LYQNGQGNVDKLDLTEADNLYHLGKSSKVLSKVKLKEIGGEENGFRGDSTGIIYQNSFLAAVKK
jgi:hypothetical protein